MTRLERLAVAVNAAELPHCFRAWVEGPDHFRVDTGPTEVTYQELSDLSPYDKDIALADWVVWCLHVLESLGKNFIAFHRYHNRYALYWDERDLEDGISAAEGPTRAEALFEALCVALNVEGE